MSRRIGFVKSANIQEQNNSSFDYEEFGGISEKVQPINFRNNWIVPIDEGQKQIIGVCPDGSIKVFEISNQESNFSFAQIKRVFSETIVKVFTEKFMQFFFFSIVFLILIIWFLLSM
jgi:hypothetical protein